MADKHDLFDWKQYVIDSFNFIIMNPKTKTKDRERSQFLLGCIFGYETYVEEGYDPNAVINAQQRRSRIRKLENDYSHDEWQATKEYFNQSCAYCGCSDERLAQDHFIPVMSSGGYTKKNIVPACKNCNSSKKDKSFFEWFKNRSQCNAANVYKILSFVR